LGGAPESRREAMDGVIDWLSLYNHRRFEGGRNRSRTVPFGLKAHMLFGIAGFPLSKGTNNLDEVQAAIMLKIYRWTS
jgi:hypothetical protein